MLRFEIREAVPEDAEEILEFTGRVGGQSDNLSYGAEGLAFSVEQERDFLGTMMAGPRSAFFCALADGRLAGTGSVSGFPRRMGHRAELAVSVDRAFWGQGIGTALTDRLISFAKARGIELLNLEVRKDNLRAIRLYQKFGFKTIGVFPAFLKVGDEYADFLLMVLDLR